MTGALYLNTVFVEIFTDDDYSPLVPLEGLVAMLVLDGHMVADV